MSVINTIAFATRNEIVQTKRPAAHNGRHIIGLDMGYSGPKCVHENGNFVFSNYCQKITGELMGNLEKNDILYENCVTNEKYSVGSMAINALNNESVVSEDALYGRNHYIHPEYKVKLETSLGIALWNVNDYSNIFIQTGLPPAYLIKDKPYLIEVIKGNHHFKLTIGSVTKEFDFIIPVENIDVMIQPMGTLNSLMIDDDGKMQPIARDLAKSNLLIFDAGFGTLDTFYICSKQLSNKTTNPNLGMRRILAETRDLIEADLGESPTIPGMQKILKDGSISVNNLIDMTSMLYPVDKYLKIANDKVCKEALESIKDYIFNIRYLIMTGGTSEAWIDDFKKSLAATGVTILKGSSGSNLSNIYSNARGYYYYRLHMEDK